MVIVLVLVIGLLWSTRLTIVTVTRRCPSLRSSVAPARLSLSVRSRILPAGIVMVARAITIRLGFFALAAEAGTIVVAVMLTVHGLVPAGQETLMPGCTSTVAPSALVNTRPEVVTLGLGR